MTNLRRAAGAIALASGFALAPGACHSALHASRDGAVEQPRPATDAQRADDAQAGDAVDTVVGSPADAGGAIPDGLLPNCGMTTYRSEWAFTDVLAVVDRSSSMALGMASDAPCDTGASDCTTRWDAVRLALRDVVPSQPHLRWSTLMFPSPGAASCEVGPSPQVPMMESAADVIDSAMSSAAPGGDSPTGAAIRAATAYLAGLADNASKAILLLTDGEPRCGGVDGGSEWTEALDAISAAKAQGLLVGVVGLGPNPGDLDRLANAGGTTRAYPATSVKQLEDTLAGIFFNPEGSVRTCTFRTPQPPPDQALVYVFLNGEAVPRDGSNGWSFGATNVDIVLNGTSCDLSSTLNPVELAIVFGCGQPVPP
jgi:Mg-chelatase subunit ChlD